MNVDLHQTDTALSETDIHDILRNDRRRNVIRVLQEHNTAVSLQELTDEVAIRETGETPPPEGTRDSVYVSLHQTHLPKLQSAGVLRYDPDRSLVKPTERAERLELQLASDPQTSVPWHRLYLALAAVSLVLLASVWADLYPFTLLSGVQYALLVISVFGTTALFHTYDLRQWRRRADNAAPDFILELND